MDSEESLIPRKKKSAWGNVWKSLNFFNKPKTKKGFTILKERKAPLSPRPVSASMLGSNAVIDLKADLTAGLKKRAPPRPPPPSLGYLRNSQSFRTLSETQAQRSGSYSRSTSHSFDSSAPRPTTGAAGKDLIDFVTPPESPETNSKSVNLKKEPDDYMYRVGASIFYVKSELRTFTPASELINPFSPPRPSAQALINASPKKASIIKPQYNKYPAPGAPDTKQAHETSNNSARNSTASGSSGWSDYSNQNQKSEPRYLNLPLTGWDDEPPETKRTSVVLPTIIKPKSDKPSLLPKPNIPGTKKPSYGNTGMQKHSGGFMPANKPTPYYDEPPGAELDDSELNDSYVSPPMPSEPPPPPPVDVAAEGDWVDFNNIPGSGAEVSEKVDNRVDGNRAYALALYDYMSDVEGDLPLQVGDLIYLIRRIDDAWLYGQCAGVEGMFPSNYVNVVVPLAEDSVPQPLTTESQEQLYTKALYQFDAETDGDLSLQPGDMVKLYGRLNDDWLYGEVGGVAGQFPANFVETIPSDLPMLNTQN